MSNAIWIGDLLIARAAIGGDDRDLETMVELLGLGPEQLDDDGPIAAEVAATTTPMTLAPPRASPAAPAGAAAATPEEEGARARGDRVLSIMIEALPREAPTAKPWQAARALRAASATHATARLLPLFPHATARALVGAAAHSVRRVGDVDLAEAVRVVAERRPMRDIPRDTARTMRAGIQLVIDQSWAMQPFADDIAVLRHQLYTVVGRDHIDELWSTGDLAACRRPRRLRARARGKDEGRASATEAWRPPEGAIPVIIVSDLGRAAAARDDATVAAQWDELRARARDAGCDVVTLVPRRVAGHDREARTSAIAWDTRTTVGAVLTERARNRG